jgi:FemAB-related protein (PEP-CTERM system-associated)
MLNDPTATRIAAFERDAAGRSEAAAPHPDARQPDGARLHALRPGGGPHVEELSEASAADWDAYVAAQPGATLYHLRAWKLVAERAYSMRAPFLIARDESSGAVRGALPLFVVDRPFGRYVTSGLFGAYGPLLADDEAAARALLLSAQRVTDAVGGRLLHLKILGQDPLPVAFDRQEIWVTAHLPLARDWKTVWDGLARNMRNQVRRARQNDLRLVAGNDRLDDFYDVLAENMHRKGSPIYGRAFMRELVEGLGDRAEVVTLRRGEETVAAALTVAFNGVLYVPFASSRARHFSLKPNHLLYWEIIQRGCERGLSVLDFGTSMRGQSTIEFKLHWHPELLPVVSHLYSGTASLSDASPTIVPTGRAVRWGMKAWQLLPRGLADALGPRVLRWTA